MVDAGHQVDDVHLGVVQAAQHGAHLGERTLVAAHIQRDGCQVHQTDGAVFVIILPAFMFPNLEPHIVQLILAGA